MTDLIKLREDISTITAKSDEVLLLEKKFNYPAPPAFQPPDDVEWVTVETKPNSEKVKATLADTDGSVMTAHGELKYNAGYVIVDNMKGDKWAVRGDVFATTYKKNVGGTYSKRAGIKLHGYIAKTEHFVPSLENKAQPTKPGDLVLRGTVDEWWPQDFERAKSKYVITPVR